MIKQFFFIIFIAIFGAGCSKEADKEVTVTNYFYDPQVPFGTINTTSKSIVDVSNLKADVSVLEKVKLTWTIPPLYSTMDYKIVIFKRRNPPDNFVLPDPSEEDSAAPFYQYKELTANELLDQNETDVEGNTTVNIFQDEIYSYWVYVKVDDKFWSKGKQLIVKTKAPSTRFEIPAASTFWDKKKWTMGYDPVVLNGNTLTFLQSMNPGQYSTSMPTGGMAFAYSGALMYVADTLSNRVLIYTRDGALACESLTDVDEKQGCLINNAGSPFTSFNILGQANTTTTYPCGDPLNTLPYSECLTRPTKLTIVGTKLYIADSGNNRIVVHNILPLNGCDINATVGYVLKRECTPSSVIGKAGLSDANLFYDIATFGNSALNYPTDMAVKDGALYIADTGNNRIVRIDNFTNNQLFNCTSSSWQTNACQFSGVLGQKNLFSKDSLYSIYCESFNDPTNGPLKRAACLANNQDALLGTDANEFVINDPLRNKIEVAFENFPKRYMRYPSRLIFNKDNSLMVLSNEDLVIKNQIGGYSSLRSRISVFPESVYSPSIGTCTSSTFDSGGCDSSIIIGQEDANQFPIVSSLTPDSYNGLSAGFFSLSDFDLREVPAEIEDDPSTEAMIATNSSNNQIYIWRNWATPSGLGYPASEKANDPAGAVNEATSQLRPDLSNLCGIKFENTIDNIYVQDCHIGRRVYEIQAYVIPLI